jgi:large subunit ribosomal protein L9
MKIILLKDTPKIGKKGELKDVNQGHATNFLIPRGFAKSISANEEKKYLEQAKANEAKDKAETDKYKEELKTLSTKPITLTEKVNEKGHLFSKISEKEIVEQVKKVFGVEITNQMVSIDPPIKEAGEHLINVLFEDEDYKLKLEIKGE